ncbi:hypothetical protein SAMN02745163_03213 [Clostridium cavendishii DSM 21758]|uniref:Uncharacterized protein n=1 Tax=Clostridium cavendishii DSM 21758 TaxID=1121302 RepID=A0A1M6PNZ5_9CLOT|nr:hypothetical protein [Clostridium cavendishii]SHK09558.1 hypothetical protein SAMN02745163_03213 [Clostridium cavendishii DSM 21758]
MLMKKTFFIIVLNDRFIVVDLKTYDRTELKFNIDKLPYTLFYHYLFENDESLEYMKKELGSKLGRIIKSDAIISIPEDSNYLDKRIVVEIFEGLGIRKIIIMSQNANFSNLETTFITLSKTERVYSLSYFKDNNLQKIKYFDINSFNLKNIELEIKNLDKDCEYNNSAFYVNCLNSNELINFGRPVYLNDFIDNFKIKQEEALKIVKHS